MARFVALDATDDPRDCMYLLFLAMPQGAQEPVDFETWLGPLEEEEQGDPPLGDLLGCVNGVPWTAPGAPRAIPCTRPGAPQTSPATQ